jgi:hypothetical protein
MAHFSRDVSSFFTTSQMIAWMQESCRTWTENMGTFLLDVIFKQRCGYMAAFVRGILLNLFKTYRLTCNTRRFFFKRF